MSEIDDITLGRLAIEAGHLTQAQLLTLLRELGAQPESTLAQLMVERGYVLPEELQELIGSQPASLPLPCPADAGAHPLAIAVPAVDEPGAPGWPPPAAAVGTPPAAPPDLDAVFGLAPGPRHAASPATPPPPPAAHVVPPPPIPVRAGDSGVRKTRRPTSVQRLGARPRTEALPAARTSAGGPAPASYRFKLLAIAGCLVLSGAVGALMLQPPPKVPDEDLGAKGKADGSSAAPAPSPAADPDTRPPSRAKDQRAPSSTDPREREVREILRAIDLLASEAGNDPAKLNEVDRRFERFRQKFNGTQWEILGIEAQKPFRERIERLADAWAEPLERKSDGESAAGRLGQAIATLEDPPPVLAATAAGRRVAARITALRADLAARHAETLRLVDDYLKGDDYDGAIERLRRVSAYGMDEQVRAATERIEKLTAQQASRRAERIKLAQVEYDTRFLPEFESRLRSGAYEAACTLAEDSMRREPLRWLRDRIELDVADARLLLAARALAQDGLAEATRAGTDLTIGEQRGRVIAEKDRFSLRCPQGGGGSKGAITLPIDLAKAPAADLIRFVALRKGHSEDDATWQFQKGLLGFYAGKPQDAQAAFARAVALLVGGGDAARADRAKAYLARLAVEVAVVQKDAAVRDLLEQVRAAFRERRYEQCLNRLGELRQAYAAHPVVVEAARELADLEARCREKLAAAAPVSVAPGSGGPVSAPAAGSAGGPGQRLVVAPVPAKYKDGYFTWTYDFRTEDQLKDWFSLNPGSQTTWRGPNRVRIQDVQMVWKGELIGDCEIETTLWIDRRSNIAVTLCDNARRNQRETQCYYFGWNVNDMPLLDLLGVAVKGSVLTTFKAPHRVVRMDCTRLAAGRPLEAVRLLAEDSSKCDPVLLTSRLNKDFGDPGTSLRVQRKGAHLEARFWMTELAAECTDLSQGHFCLCLDRNGAEINKVTITGVLAGSPGEAGGKGK